MKKLLWNFQSSFLSYKKYFEQYKKCNARYAKHAGYKAAYKIYANGKIEKAADEICKYQKQKTGEGVEHQLENKFYRRGGNFEHHHSAQRCRQKQKNDCQSFHSKVLSKIR